MDKPIIVNQRLIFAILFLTVMVFAVIVWMSRTGGRLPEMFQIGVYPTVSPLPSLSPSARPSSSPSINPSVLPSISPSPSISSCRLSLRVGPGPSISPSPSPSVSASPAAAGQIKANFDGIPDGRKNFQINLTAKEITAWSAAVQLDTSGQAGVADIFGSAFTPSQSYNFVLNKFVPFLSKVKAAVFTANTAIDFGTAGTGDLNGDNQVNTLDWSLMKLKFGAEATLEQGDLNLDGMINTIDWSLMKKWFGQSGES